MILGFCDARLPEVEGDSPLCFILFACESRESATCEEGWNGVCSMVFHATALEVK